MEKDSCVTNIYLHISFELIRVDSLIILDVCIRRAHILIYRRWEMRNVRYQFNWFAKI